MMKIQIIGAGFVGQATGRGFLAHGHEVTFVDIDTARLTALNQQGLTAHPPAQAGNDAEISILTLPTPTVDGQIDLRPLRSATAALAARLAGQSNYHLVVVRSTVVPGTTEALIKILEQGSGRRVGPDIGVCMNPEFLREKNAQADFVHPWLIVIGEYDQRAGDTLAVLYQDFGCPMHRTSLREAELQKYVHNLFNAVKIAFFNEMRQVARAADIDPEVIFPLVAKSAEGMWNATYGTKDHGPFNGSCLPKDSQAFLDWAHARGWPMPILASAIAANSELAAAQANAESRTSAAATPAPLAVAESLSFR